MKCQVLFSLEKKMSAAIVISTSWVNVLVIMHVAHVLTILLT